LPDFATLAPVSEQVVERVGVAARPRGDEYALRFRGLLEVPATGVWEFRLTSDDGSRLLIDGELVIDNDGLHSATERTGRIALEKGLHRLEVGFFEASGQDDVVLEWSGPGVERQAVPASACSH